MNPSLKLFLPQYQYICAYICVYIGAYISLLRVYMLIIYVYIFLFLEHRIISFFICFFIRLNTCNLYSSSERSHLQGECPICPRLNIFISASEWGFVFIRFFFQHNFISDSIIVVDSIIFLRRMPLFIFIFYADVYTSYLLRDLLGKSCLVRKSAGLDFFLQSCDMLIVPQRQLPLGFPSMGQRHLHMPPVG